MVYKVTLDTNGLAYSVDYGFFEGLRTGQDAAEGFVPLAHLNAVEYTQTRALPPAVAYTALALIAVGTFWGGPLRISGGLFEPTLLALLGAVVLAGWFLLKSSVLIFYAEGRPMVRVRMPSAEAVKLFNEYKTLRGSK